VFQVLLFGTAVYDGAVKTWDDDVHYEQVSLDPHQDEIASVEITKAGTPILMSSPALTRSPLIYNAAKKEALAAELRAEKHGQFNSKTNYASTGTTKFDRPAAKVRSGSENT
jgi:hypothetical protein